MEMQNVFVFRHHLQSTKCFVSSARLLFYAASNIASEDKRDLCEQSMLGLGQLIVLLISQS